MGSLEIESSYSFGCYSISSAEITNHFPTSEYPVQPLGLLLAFLSSILNIKLV